MNVAPLVKRVGTTSDRVIPPFAGNTAPICHPGRSGGSLADLGIGTLEAQLVCPASRHRDGVRCAVVIAFDADDVCGNEAVLDATVCLPRSTSRAPLSRLRTFPGVRHRTPIQGTDDPADVAATAIGGLRLEDELRSLLASVRYRGAAT